MAGFITASSLLGIVYLISLLFIISKGNKREQSELDKFRHGEVEPSKQQQWDNLYTKLIQLREERTKIKQEIHKKIIDGDNGSQY